MGRPFFWGAKGVHGGEKNARLVISECRVRLSRNPTRISRKYIRKNDVETYKKIINAGCVTLYSGAKIALFYFAKHFRMRF